MTVQPVAPASSSSASSPYGLTNGWGTAGINIDGLPTQVMVDVKAALQKAGVDTTQPTIPGDAVVKALATLPRNDVQQVQQMLYYGGFYASSINSLTDLQLGRFQSTDVDALKNVVQSAGQTGQPLGAYLVGAANYGQAQGTIKQVSGVVTPTTIPVASDEDTAIEAAASKLLDHAPSAQDIATFRGVVDKMFQARMAQSNTINAEDPDAVGQAAGRLGLAGYFGNPQEAPPTPGTGNNSLSPWQSLISGPRGVMGPGAPQAGVPATQADAQEFGQEQNSANYLKQHAADQATISQFQSTADAATGSATGGPPLPTSAGDLETTAEQFIQDRYGQQIAQHGAVGAYNELLAVMGK